MGSGLAKSIKIITVVRTRYFTLPFQMLFDRWFGCCFRNEVLMGPGCMIKKLWYVLSSSKRKNNKSNVGDNFQMKVGGFMNSIYHLKCCKKNKIVIYIYIYILVNLFFSKDVFMNHEEKMWHRIQYTCPCPTASSKYSKILYRHNEWALLLCYCELIDKWVGLPNLYTEYNINKAKCYSFMLFRL